MLVYFLSYFSFLFTVSIFMSILFSWSQFVFSIDLEFIHSSVHSISQKLIERLLYASYPYRCWEVVNKTSWTLHSNEEIDNT